MYINAAHSILLSGDAIFMIIIFNNTHIQFPLDARRQRKPERSIKYSMTALVASIIGIARK
jgi:hypothetical protein